MIKENEMKDYGWRERNIFLSRRKLNIERVIVASITALAVLLAVGEFSAWLK